jgi:putative membrane protein
MLLHDAALSFLHFVFVLILAGALSAELFVLRLPVTATVARLLLRVDLFYAIAAVGLIVAGFARAIWGAAGWDYYAGQPFFWTKIAAFVVIGLLSIVPTLSYFRWVKAAASDAGFLAPEAELKRVRLIAMIEIHLLVLVIAFATLMARGIGG